MINLLMAVVLLSPMVGKEKIQWDTLNTINIQVVSGFNVGSSITDPGPEFGVKGEYVLAHPFAVRLGAIANFSKASDLSIGKGNQQNLMFSAEVMTYRGRLNQFIYIGIGLLYGYSWYDPTSLENLIFYDPQTDEPFENIDLYDAEIDASWGYQAFGGFRYKDKYAIEIGLKVYEPDFAFLTNWPRDDEITQARFLRKKKISTLWVTLGYVFAL